MAEIKREVYVLQLGLSDVATWEGLQFTGEIDCVRNWNLLFLASPFSMNNLPRTGARVACNRMFQVMFKVFFFSSPIK